MENKKRKICFVTGNRAEYSRIRTVLEELKNKLNVDFYIVAMGSHLLDSFGKTVNDIIADGYKVDYRIFMELEGREPSTMAKSVGIATCDLATYFENKRPDLVVALMDRYENIAVAIAAAFMNIPIAHMQGGEVSGTIDESVRHTITKLAHIHFPATEQSRERIIKMGERPEMVFNTGDPASDLLLSIDALNAKESIERLNQEVVGNETSKINFDSPYILAVQHPVTTEFGKGFEQIKQSLFALKKIGGHSILFLLPNIDAGGLHILEGIRNFQTENKLDNLFVLKHIPHNIFINLMRNAKCMMGNSSSGIREACYFGTPVVNVGTRQQYRERGKNVIDAYNEEDICDAINKQLAHGRYEPEFLYGDGRAGKRIADILASIDIDKIEIQKRMTY
jgi:UDP-hydrolysing UDP-N-acetyl-D-glucosamine 2-epimerase